jgi:uncharacterized membrane protein YvlD (DUF360 family)
MLARAAMRRPYHSEHQTGSCLKNAAQDHAATLEVTMIFLVQMLLVLTAMLWLVPVLTDNGVQVRGGFVKATLILLGIAFLDAGLWIGLTALTVFTNLIANFLTLGLVGLLVRALAYWLFGRMFPGCLYVRSYGSALGAAIIMTVASWGILHLIN